MWMSRAEYHLVGRRGVDAECAGRVRTRAASRASERGGGGGGMGPARKREGRRYPAARAAIDRPTSASPRARSPRPGGPGRNTAQRFGRAAARAAGQGGRRGGGANASERMPRRGGISPPSPELHRPDGRRTPPLREFRWHCTQSFFGSARYPNKWPRLWRGGGLIAAETSRFSAEMRLLVSSDTARPAPSSSFLVSAGRAKIRERGRKII